MTERKTTEMQIITKSRQKKKRKENTTYAEQISTANTTEIIKNTLKYC